MRAAPPVNPGLRATLVTYLGAALAVFPLCELFTDRGWLLDVWAAMAVTLAPAALLRLRRRPGPLQVWLGLALLVPWLTLRFAPGHAVLGVLPTRASGADVTALVDGLHAVIHGQTAPVHSTTATTAAVSVLAGLVMAMLDLIVVVGRRSLLAGIPLLVIFSASGAVARHTVSWVWFAAAAAGFLLLLSADAEQRLSGWGHRVRDTATAWRRGGFVRGGQRIAALSIAVGVLVPVLIPIQSANLLGGWPHRSGSGSGSGGAGTALDPFARLKGQLRLSEPVDLFTVRISNLDPGTQPFFLRTNVLSTFVGSGWREAAKGVTEPLRLTTYAGVPDDPVRAGSGFEAQISISGLAGNPPVFARPVRVRGLPAGSTWDPLDQLVAGTSVHRGQTYAETVVQPEPDVSTLLATPEGAPAELRGLLRLPQLPSEITGLVSRLTSAAGGPYARARAISDYFTDPANGFRYSLATAAGDSGNELLDFLRNKTGFCQQYAAAMAVMLRLARVPSRVVLGYAHQRVNASGQFTVTTRDAHAWVEAYFAGVGWVPFNPTPLIGTPGGSAGELPWAPHGGADAAPSAGSSTSPGASRAPETTASEPAALSGADSAVTAGERTGLLAVLVLGAGALLVAALLAAPGAVRALRRRRRLRAGDAGALWAELSDTAVDLGYVWSEARSPRQVAGWLDGPAGPAAEALRGLASAVERERYAPPAAMGRAATATREDLEAVQAQLRRTRGRRTRLRATLWPASLGWSRHLLPPAGRRPRRH